PQAMTARPVSTPDRFLFVHFNISGISSDNVRSDRAIIVKREPPVRLPVREMIRFASCGHIHFHSASSYLFVCINQLFRAVPEVLYTPDGSNTLPATRAFEHSARYRFLCNNERLHHTLSHYLFAFVCSAVCLSVCLRVRRM